MTRFLLILMSAVSVCITQINAQSLVHYWNFNNTSSEAEILAPTTTSGGASISHIAGGESIIQITSNTGQGFDVTNPNARNGDESGAHLRFNNPIGGGLLISLPTTGYQQPVVQYATRRSGSGAGTQIIEYSVDGISFDTFTLIQPVDGDPTLQTLDFTAIPGVHDNALFQIRITFEQGPGGAVGNNRFDNLTLDAFPLGDDVVPPSVSFIPIDQSINQPLDLQPRIVFNEDVRLTDDSPVSPASIQDVVQLWADSLNGEAVAYTGSYFDRVITIQPLDPLHYNRQYLLQVNPGGFEDTSDNVMMNAVSATFRTTTQQTIFQPGDMVPIAYHMNAEGAEDEVALVTFVNILPETRIRMTDAKYTDNDPAQCPGGIEWTSPSTIVPAGTVIRIANDAGTANIGTVSGSTFGLSSNGDQFIVYTGANTAPSYITALSSNAWVVSPHTGCGGSLSLIPAALEDGVSSINLSTAPGNTGGNTVNAYYNGIQDGSVEELRNAILDPVNWVGVEAGTQPQDWPDYVFPGPPNVVEVMVKNQTTIEVIFTEDMDPVSAGDLTSYNGPDGLQSAVMTDNGAARDTVTLTFSTPFVFNETYTLIVDGVYDAEGLEMPGPYEFSFTYVTSLEFEDRYMVVGEDAGTVHIPLELLFPGVSTVEVVYQGAPYSTASNDDFAPHVSALTLDGTSTSPVTIQLSIVDDAVLEQDEYIVIALSNPEFVQIEGPSFFTVYIRDNDNPAPQATEDIELEFISRYTVANPDELEGLAEIVAFDPWTQRLYAISTALQQFDIVDFANPSNPTTIKTVSTTAYGSGITSVAVYNGVVAVSVPGIVSEQDQGAVVFFNADGDYIRHVAVGALPDMITFSPDGLSVLTANEGQPNDAYTLDPEGSVSVIDISAGVANVDASDVTTISFAGFNGMESELVPLGFRKLKASSTLAQDVEPEYITISKDGQKAWVTLQENNAIAVLNLETNTVTDILPLGTKDYSAPGNGLDLSDRNEEIVISNWPLHGYYVPDAISTYTANDVTYVVTANEGDEKEYGGLNERTTVGAVNLDPVAFPNAAMLQENHNMGRFRITNLSGDTDGDGDFDELYCNGGRSFTIWNAETGERVWDSGDAFERITSQSPEYSVVFNADNTENTLKSRSRAKGPEPEGLVIVPLNNRTYAFIMLERTGGVMVYDITDPMAPEFTDYINSRDLEAFAGDNGPESGVFIEHANGNFYFIEANEISGTLAVFEVNHVTVSTDQPSMADQYQLSPNPVVSGRVHIGTETTFAVYDLHGRVRLDRTRSNGFDVNGWEPGLYVVKYDDGSTSTCMVVSK